MTYNLNLIPGKVPVAVHVKQYDTGLREIEFNLYYGDTAYSVPYNSTITVSGTKPDGNGFSYSVTFSGSAVTVPMQEQMTVLAGEFPCQLTIANSGEIIGTASFLLCVEPAALSSDTPVSDTDLAMFQQLANQTQTEAAGVANATAQIATNTQNIAANTQAIAVINGGNVASNGIAMGDASSFSSNFLQIDLNGGPTASVNRRASFGWTSATKSSYSNIPTELANEDTAVGVREVYWIDSTHVIVMVHEAYPQLGRTHYIFYNSGSWGAWYTVLPSNGTVETLGVESGWTATQSWCKKRAAVVEFYLEITGGTLSSGWNTVGTLPSGYRPGIAFDMLGLDNGASSPANGVQTKVTTAGLIQVYKLSDTTNSLRLHGTFLI